ncbi:MAG: helix-turn-helix transcriptional regulator [Candidatus Atabeyarchaeum deiterrae]
MPGEKGEKLREKAENPREEDGEWDYLSEWCLEEYERSMNSPVESNETTIKVDEMEGHRISAEIRNQSTNTESENPSADGDRLKQKEEDADRKREAIGEHPQRSEQQRQQHPNNVDMRGQGETKDNTKIRGDGDASTRTKKEHHSNPDRAEAEQATYATELGKIRVYDARVVGAGELVREWRTELGLSRRELADELGYSESQLSYLESNKEHTALHDLQQLSHMTGKDLEQELREFRSSESQNIAIKWKGAIYSIDAFIESTRNPDATIDYSQAQQTYYLKLNPMTNVEFHRRDIITTLLEKNGVQAIAELKAVKGTRANTTRADVESMGIKVGDKVDVNVLNVRGPEGQPWKQSIQVEPATTNGETKIQLHDKLGELGFNVRNGDYAKMVIQTERGERLVVARIEDGAINLSKKIAEELLTNGGDGEANTFRVKTNSIVLSPEPLKERTSPREKRKDKTVLKLEGEGHTITHENQNYKITTVEQERIGNLELYRYKTDQGEEFLRIPKENKTAPPYETPWYALPLTTMVYLDKEYKQELLQAAINKAGGKTPLRQELKDRGTQICIKYLNDQLSERMDGMVANKLIPILRYLGRDLDESNSHITAIGNRRAVENPNLPFKLNTTDGARLHAARFSDGSIHTPKGAGPRFDYTNKDAEQRNRIAESLTNVFGRPNILDREYTDGRIARVRATTDIVGHVLQRSGAITGRIILQNPDIPTFIRNGSIEMKREWLKQAFGDEGSPSPHCGITTLTRAVDVTQGLSDGQRNRLDAMSEHWREKVPKVVVREKHVRYCMFKDLPLDIRNALQPERPRLLESEARMLHEDFGITVNKHPIEIYKREDGYSVSWALQITSKRDNRVFCDEIGFPQSRKQEKLKSMMESGSR